MSTQQATLSEVQKQKLDEDYPSAAYAWGVVGALMMAYTLSFIDRQILSLLVGPIREDLQIGDFEVGLLGGFAFALFYTFVGLPMGRAADRFHRVGIISAGIFIWSLMTCVCGLAKNFWHLFFARMGVGLGEAALSPPAYSLITDYFPPHRLARALSVYGMGIYIGTAMAFILGGAVVQAVQGMDDILLPVLGTIRPWQLTFFIVGLPGILLAVLILLIREPKRRGALRLGDDGKVQSIPFTEVFGMISAKWKVFTAHFVGFAMMSFVGYGATAWKVPFMERVFDIPAYMGGYIYGGLVLVFGPIGIFLGGTLADRFKSRGMEDSYLRVTSWAAGLTIPFAILSYLTDYAWLSIACLGVMALLGAMPFGCAPAALQHIVPNQMRAQVSALYLFVTNMIGLGLGPPIAGALSDYVFNEDLVGDDTGVRYSLVLMVCIACPIGVLLLRWGLKHYRQAVADAKALAAA